MSRLLLLDGHSLAYRAFFALPAENFSTSTGQHTNGVYGFVAMLINVLRDEDPTHVAVAFDVSRVTFRSEEYAEYKAGRSETPSAFRGQVSLLKEVLDALNITRVELEGFEADDAWELGVLTREIAAAAVYILDAAMTVDQVAGSWAPYLTMAEGIKIAAQSFSADMSRLSCCAS